MPSSAKLPTLKAFEELMEQLNFRMLLGGNWVDGFKDTVNEDNNTEAKLIFACEFNPDADASGSPWKFSIAIIPHDKKLGNPQTPKEIAEYLHSYLRIAAAVLMTAEPS